MSELEQLKQRQSQVWGLGDYSVLARRFEPAAVALCDACAVGAGQEVLDVGAGSAFGAFIAPRPEVAVAEMFRVVRPGGTVGLTLWTTDGFFGELSEVGQRFNPTPAGLARPQEWGDEAVARARIEPLASHVETEVGTVTFTGDSPEALAAEMADSSPPYAAARNGLPPEQYEELVRDTVDLMRRWATEGDDGVQIVVEYLIVVARKRG